MMPSSLTGQSAGRIVEAETDMRGVHIYIDIDDVLAETTRAINDVAESLFGTCVPFESMVEFDLAHSLHLDSAQHAILWRAIHEPSFLENLTPMENAVATTNRWHQAGAEISIVTGRPPESRASSVTWLNRFEIGHDRLEMVDKYGRFAKQSSLSKEELADRPYTWVIEDSLEMAQFFSERTQARVLLMDRPWNQTDGLRFSRTQRVRDWTAIAIALRDGRVRSEEPIPENERP